MVFQINTKTLFLTYPQSPLDWDKDYLLRKLKELVPLVARAVVGRELHADGSPHFHVCLGLDEVYRSRDERCLDIDGHHPNIQSARSPSKAAAYCKKDGDYLEEGDWAGPLKPGWGDLLGEATDVQSFLALVKSTYPRDFVLNHEKLLYFAKQQYRTIIEPYIPNPDHVFIIPNELSDWNNQRRNGDRPKSLWLCGNTRLGKTQWARSLGSHIYWNNQYNLDDWNPDAEYLVIDDIDWKYVPAKKALLGAQLTFTLTDKYRKKVTLNWGKPVIYLCNKDMDVYHTCDESDWLRDNCTYIFILNKLFGP
nr:MAG: replication associated protein [Cressdnaviricota sp.]